MDLDRFLYLLFCIPSAFIEIYISMKKHSLSVSKSSTKDRGTFIILWLIIACSQIFSLHYIKLGYGSKIIENKFLKFSFWIPFNISLCLMGHLLRKQAIEQLGQWFTTNVRIDENHQLIDVGWYGKMRHPSYTGVLMYFLALALLLNNWLSLFGIMIPVCLAFLYRIHIEEEELKKYFGIKYEEYQKKVPNAIIPKIF